MTKPEPKPIPMTLARALVIVELYKQGIKLSYVSKHNIDKAAKALTKLRGKELAKLWRQVCR